MQTEKLPRRRRRTSVSRGFGRVSGVSALLVGLLATGCAGGGGAANHPAKSVEVVGPITPTPVDDAAFATSTYRVLMGTDTGVSHLSLLAGAVARQLERAGARFRAGEDAGGFAALEGAFLLMRRGEFRREGIAQAGPVLERGAAEAARLGQEGYSLALYSLLEGVLPKGPARADVETHLQAMSAFSATGASAGPVASAGASARVALQRALLDGSEQRFYEASKVIVAWLESAHTAALPDQPIRSNAERDEALEAFRAVRGGGFTLLGLYLRHGDPLGALTTMDESGFERLLPADLRTRLEACAEDNDPAAWYDIYRFYDSALEEGQSLLSLDPELLQGASFGIALSLFRAEPGSYRGAMPLATKLVQQGMAEVAPLVLTSGLTRGATPEQLGAALALVASAAVAEADAGQQEAARRTFQGAAPLLELAEHKPFLGRVSPSPARVHYLMGALEANQGELARADPLLRDAVQKEPTIDALKLLAAIARQRDDAANAIAYLDRARDLAERSNDAAEEADLWRARFEVLRDQGDKKAAQQALESALSRALDAGRQGRPGTAQARAERQLARVLEHYGDRAALRRATDRAYDAAAADARELGATILDAGRRAITRGDLAIARSAVQRGVESSLPAEDLVYLALWLKLLEKQLAVPSDGSAEDALTSLEDATGWIAKLRAWGRGKLTDAELVAQAQDRVERTEASFYVAMSKRARGDQAAYAELARVAKSETVNLVEIGIARDLVALHAGAETGLRLPASVELP
jgi:cellulose synthase operon protein C